MSDQSLEQAIFESDFSSAIERESSQVLRLPGEIFVEIVLQDNGRLDEIGERIRQALRVEAADAPFTLIVRKKWRIADIGDPSPAYGPDGGLRAAVLVPVTLVSGADSVLVTVSITKLAEMEFERILGTGAGLMKRVATAVVRSSLQRGGRSYWNPIEESYLEVASSGVANISRLLKQAA